MSSKEENVERELLARTEKLDKLIKENKELNIILKQQSKDIGYMVLNYIPKDKVLKKLDYLDEEGYFEFNTDRDLTICCEILRELLQDNK